MARRKRPQPTGTHATALGSVTHNGDGTMDITIDPVKLDAHVLAQHERVLADVKAAKASGMFPAGMLAELETIAQTELDKVKQRPPSTAAIPTLRMKP